ncbi:MAG TPA: AMP-binding protein [Candidatus Acidoferrales bacterium]|nr:AMP-binding protein [Candidatus Acidoferrales bacterium]
MENNPLSNDRHLGALFFRRVGELGDKMCVKLQRGTRFEEISWRELGAKVHDAILGLYVLGLNKGDKVGILADNSLEWLCADLSTLAGGFPNVVVSPTVSETMLIKTLGHSCCRAVFAGNEVSAGRLLNLKGQLSALQHIIILDGSGGNLPNSLTLDGLLALGAGQKRERLGEILESIHPDDLGSIMYTSGSTGAPKGVMRTQGNLISNISNGSEIVLSKPDELAAIVLSLNHLLGRFGFLKSAVTGRSTAVIEATEQSLDMKVIKALSATAMTIVPRVMEKVWNTILDEGTTRAQWEQLEKLDTAKQQNGGLSADEAAEYEHLRTAVRETAKQALGGRIKYITYGGAAMPPRIMHFFRLVGIPLLGTYGSTECGGITLSGFGDTKPGSLGKPFPNVELKIADDGEILVRGPTVMPGYFENPEATREAIDEEGWYYSGDLGKIDADGCLYIVGRKKDVFYCPDGSNIYPGYIELLLENDVFIHQAILLGDKRPFMAALIVPDRKRIAAELGKDEAALTESDIRSVIQPRVDEINGRVEDIEKIRKFVLVHDEFPTAVRSLNLIHKVKIERSMVEKLYEKEIKEIYPSAV